ncbi:MAG: hydrogen gas-evolving membrane-bound hydrogenase subunit E [Chloroflexota bacterium]
MTLALINFVPFIMALFGLTPLNRMLPKVVRTWLAAGVMLVLFGGVVSYLPQVQDVDTAYSIENGIALEYGSYESDSDYEGESSDSASAETDSETTADDTASTSGSDYSDNDKYPESLPDDVVLTDDGTLAVNAIVQAYEWVPEIGLTLSFYLDGLSLLFAMIVTGIGALIFLYAGYYFEDEADQSRFITILFAFAGAMLGLVLSGNLITLFIMWELTSITSFLLIGFKGAKYEDARFGATQAFVITGIGGLTLIGGVVLLAYITGDVTGGGLVFDMVDIMQADPTAIGAHPLYVGALVLLGLAAFTKSAQFPFHFWLPGAMAAPTPASAYLHSATMVKAGVYLLLRLYPIMNTNILWTQVLVTVGIGTMFIAAFIALWQRDLKGLLAYTTISWLGALVGMIGLPNSAGIETALVGIIAHALYKAALFLSAGTIDHNVGTRIVDKLGGLRKQMPIIAGVVIVSCLSMAGLPIFFGFVAKEVLLKAWIDVSFNGQFISYIIICVAAGMAGTAGFIFIWDVFFKEPTEEIHYHESSIFLSIPPLILAIGTTLFGFFLDAPIPIIDTIVGLGVPEPIDVYLLPKTPTDPVFWTSMSIVAGGFLLFLIRGIWLPILSALPLPRTTDVYRALVGAVEWVGDQALKSQNGQVRYYLVVIFGTVAMTLLSTGLVANLAASEPLSFSFADFDAATAYRAVLLFLIVVAGVLSVVVRKHINAILALGIVGYAVGGLFLIEPAPDVSMVQFLMETLATILLIIMLGRISSKQRRDVMSKLWKGRSNIGETNIGILRDLLIAGAVGVAVFFFSLTALSNRTDRDSISTFHLEQTEPVLDVTDVVGAIVADWRAMDTFVEAAVFAVAALGVVSLLTRGLSQINPFVPSPKLVKNTAEFSEESLEQVEDQKNLDTPFTRMVARVVLVLSFIIAVSHIINGSFGPGDGFTAGAFAGLGTALWFVVFGYSEATKRIAIYAPHRLLRAGLLLLCVNGLLALPLGFSNSAFLAYGNYGALLGIDGLLDAFGLKLTTTLIFEIGIALVVMGGITLIMESIAHPTESLRDGFAQAQDETKEDGQ